MYCLLLYHFAIATQAESLSLPIDFISLLVYNIKIYYPRAYKYSIRSIFILCDYSLLACEVSAYLPLERTRESRMDFVEPFRESTLSLRAVLLTLTASSSSP